MSKAKKPIPENIADDDEWLERFRALNDDEQIERARQCRNGLAQLIEEGGPFDPKLLADLDEYIAKFEKAIETERKATEAAKRAVYRTNRTADALLAKIPANKRVSFFVPPVKPRKKKGN